MDDGQRVEGRQDDWGETSHSLLTSNTEAGAGIDIILALSILTPHGKKVFANYTRKGISKLSLEVFNIVIALPFLDENRSFTVKNFENFLSLPDVTDYETTINQFDYRAYNMVIGGVSDDQIIDMKRKSAPHILKKSLTPGIQVFNSIVAKINTLNAEVRSSGVPLSEILDFATKNPDAIDIQKRYKEIQNEVISLNWQ